MLKKYAIEDAQKKANRSKQPQVVFRYISGIDVKFDYTSQHLWHRRRQRMPVATTVTTVIPTTTHTD